MPQDHDRGTARPDPRPVGVRTIPEDLARFVADAPVALAMLDRDLRYVAWSNRWLAINGLIGGDLVGRCHDDVFPSMPECWADAKTRALAGESLTCEESRQAGPDGPVTWVRWRITPVFDQTGEVTGLALFNEDITRRKSTEDRLRASEDRMRLTTEVAGIGQFEKDFTDTTYQVSDSFRALVGFEGLDLAQMLQRWEEMVDPGDLAGLRAEFERVIAQEGDGRVARDLRLNVAGEQRYMQFIAQVHFSGTGDDRHAHRVVGLLIDQTESRKLQEALSRAQRLETVGRLAGTIAHDFNNLLTVILSNLELAELRSVDDNLRKHLQRAIEAAEMGANFNKRLLALASGRQSQQVVLNLDAHIARTWALAQQVLGEAIDLRFHPGTDGACAQVDASELDGALLNILTNARDAQPQGGKVTVTTSAITLDRTEAARIAGGEPGDYLRLTVTDEGTGMPPDVARRAQEPFFSTKAPGRGTGLGLTSVATTAARAGGFVRIDSTEGNGSSISIYLPRVAAEATPASSEAKDDLPFGDGELVLVVEDDPLVRETVLQRLEAIGYAVLEAATIEAALDLLAAGEPVDLVFSDVVLPGRDSGYDLVDAVRRTYPDVAVLLTSGHVSKTQMPRAPDASDPELLSKPYSLARLAQAVARAFTLARQTRT